MLDRQLPVGAWGIPGTIDLDDSQQNLVWDVGDNPRVALPAPGILTDFIRLSGSDPSGVLELARKWGVLGLCEHDLPASHRPMTTMPGLHWRGGCKPVQTDPSNDFGPYVERLDVWRHLSARVQTLVKLVAMHRRGEIGPETDWRLATAIPERQYPEFWDRSDPTAREKYGSLIAFTAQEFIEIGNVEPRIRRNDRGDYVVTFGPGRGGSGYGGMFAAVATQLAFMLAREDDLAICSGCGEPYSLEVDGRPKRGTRTYCKRCREDGTAARIRQRNARQRRKATA